MTDWRWSFLILPAFAAFYIYRLVKARRGPTWPDVAKLIMSTIGFAGAAALAFSALTKESGAGDFIYALAIAGGTVLTARTLGKDRSEQIHDLLDQEEDVEKLVEIHERAGKKAAKKAERLRLAIPTRLPEPKPVEKHADESNVLDDADDLEAYEEPKKLHR